MPLPFPDPDKQTCHLVLVRHGATANNLENPPKIQGRRSDLDLSETGLRQAAETAEFLATANLTAVYSSPLRRAAMTAEAIAARHDLSVRPVDAISECDVGNWEGRSWVEIERTEPEAHERFMTEPDRHGYAGGENLTQLLERVIPAFESIMEEHAGKTIVAVAHNVVNRSYLGRLLNLPPARARSIPQHNCGVNVIRWRQGQAKPLTINLLSHLSDW